MLVAISLALCSVTATGVPADPPQSPVAFKVVARSGDAVTTPFGPGEISFPLALVVGNPERMVLHAIVAVPKPNAGEQQPLSGFFCRDGNGWRWLAPSRDDWADGDTVRWIDILPKAVGPDGTIAATFYSGTKVLDYSGPRGLLVIHPDGRREILTRSDKPSPSLPDASEAASSEYRFFSDGTLRFSAKASGPSSRPDPFRFGAVSLWSWSKGELHSDLIHGAPVKGMEAFTADLGGANRFAIDRWLAFERKTVALPVTQSRRKRTVVVERGPAGFNLLLDDPPTVMTESGKIEPLTVINALSLLNGDILVDGMVGKSERQRTWMLKAGKLEPLAGTVNLAASPRAGAGKPDSLAMIGELENGEVLFHAYEGTTPAGLVAIKDGTARWLTWAGAPLPGGGSADPERDWITLRPGMRAALYHVDTGVDKPPRYMRLTAAGLSEVYSPDGKLPGLDELGPVKLGSPQTRLTPQVDGWITATVYPANGRPIMVATNINAP